MRVIIGIIGALFEFLFWISIVPYLFVLCFGVAGIALSALPWYITGALWLFIFGVVLYSIQEGEKFTIRILQEMADFFDFVLGFLGCLVGFAISMAIRYFVKEHAGTLVSLRDFLKWILPIESILDALTSPRYLIALLIILFWIFIYLLSSWLILRVCYQHLRFVYSFAALPFPTDFATPEKVKRAERACHRCWYLVITLAVVYFAICNFTIHTIINGWDYIWQYF